MWKNSLPVFTSKHDRTGSSGVSLISSRPISPESLASVHEEDLGIRPYGATAPRTTVEDPTAATIKNQVANTVTAMPTPPDHPDECRDVESNGTFKMRSLREFFSEEIDTAQASAPLSVYCFMTGFVDAVCFSAIFVWCAFQTGNTIQLSLAVARLFNGQHDYTFHLGDQQALCSLLCFVFGAFIGRIGDKMGVKTRMWLTTGTLIQTLLTMGGAIMVWRSHSGSIGNDRGDPAWSNTLSFLVVGFLSASMGLQGIMGKRLNTQFTTTVVLTTTWCEFVTEPQLFNLRRLIISRDHKFLAIFFLFLGGFTGRALVDAIGSAGTLGVGTGIRFVVTLWWFLIPAKKASL